MAPMPLRSIGVAERPAASLQSQLEGLLEGPQDCVYGIDNAGRATMVTPSVAAMTGYTLDDLDGPEHARAACTTRTRTARTTRPTSCPIYAAFRDGRVHTAEEVFWRKDGTSFPVGLHQHAAHPGGRRGRSGGGVPRPGGKRICTVGCAGCWRRWNETRPGPRRATRPAGPASPPGPRTGRTPRSGGSGLHGPTASGQAAVGCSPPWLVLRRTCAGWPTPTARSCCWAKAAPARSWWHGPSTSGVRGGNAPLVKVNCAAIPATLVESELFGHERGAFTGATGLPPGALRAGRAGARCCWTRWASCRWTCRRSCCACCRSGSSSAWAARAPSAARPGSSPPRTGTCGRLVAAGRFRADLYYRLNVFPLQLPPLRERRGDVPLLARHFLGKLARRLGRPLAGFTAESERRLC